MKKRIVLSILALTLCGISNKTTCFATGGGEVKRIVISSAPRQSNYTQLSPSLRQILVLPEQSSDQQTNEYTTMTTTQEEETPQIEHDLKDIRYFLN